MCHPAPDVLLTHLFDNFNKGFVNCFCLPVPLWVVRQWPMVLHLVEFYQLSIPSEARSGNDRRACHVAYDSVRYPKSGNYILFYEVCHGSASGFMKWYGLYPLGEILCSYKDPYKPVERQIDWPCQVKPLGVEGLWGDHALQALWVGTDQIGLHLAAMTLLHKLYCVLSHSGPVVAHLQDAPI